MELISSWRTSAASTLTVTEPAAPPAPAFSAIPPLSGSSAAAAVTYGLAAYQTKAGVGALTWTLVGAVPAGVSLAASTGVLTVAKGTVLTAQPLFVQATNANGASATQGFVATVTAPPSPNGQIAPIVAASASNVSLSTSSNFVAPMSNSTYSLSNNPLGNASINASSGVVTLAAVSGCNAQYPLAVRLTDPLGAYATEVVSVTSVAPPTQSPALPAVTLAASSNASVALAGFFQTAYGAPLAYSLTASPNSNVAIAGGVATVTSALRGTTYSVGFKATDALGQATTQLLSVSELVAVAPSQFPPSAVPNCVATFTDANNVGYTFSTQGGYNKSCWIFCRNVSYVSWMDCMGGYNSSTGAYTGTATATNGVTGSWFEVDLSKSITVTGYSVSLMSPWLQWYLYGSNNGTTWVQIDVRTYASWTLGNAIQTYSFTNSLSFSMYRYVISNSKGTPGVGQFWLVGA